MEQIATTDNELLFELRGGIYVEDGKLGDDTSEFSAVTHQSYVSYRSDRSTISQRSNSTSMSTVSNSSSNSSVSKSFSIEGLDHSLLSRGNNIESSGNGRGKGSRSKKEKDNLRRKKRKEKSNNKTAGSGRDEWGLFKENEMCEELISLALVFYSSIQETTSLFDVLLLGYGKANVDREMAIRLQQGLEEFSTEMNKHLSLVFAPEYPSEWLEKKAMRSVKHFQRKVFSEGQAINTKKVKLWWELVEEALLLWKGTRKESLIVVL
jgi:hypothetical protein